jgi:methylthioribose-1-phosphate isomerase
MEKVFTDNPSEEPQVLLEKFFEEAKRFALEDQFMCDAIGKYGAELLPKKGSVITHCNAGALATVGTGTALAPIYEAVSQGKHIEVWARETRPLLQGARITAWELNKAGIPVTVICDSAAGYLMTKKWISAVIVGADRVALNGDVANKVGTYPLAVMASRHHIPFFVAAPSTTFDLECSCGDQIPNEERSGAEIRFIGERKVVPDSVPIFNPAFDITPAELITAIITEKGLISPVGTDQILSVLTQGKLPQSLKGLLK